MKKVIAIIAVAIASMSIAHAQFGIVAGFTSSSTDFAKDENGKVDWKANAESVSLYHVGLTYKLDLGLGLAIQPSLTYEMKGAKLSEAFVEGVLPCGYALIHDCKRQSVRFRIRFVFDTMRPVH